MTAGGPLRAATILLGDIGGDDDQREDSSEFLDRLAHGFFRATVGSVAGCR